MEPKNFNMESEFSASHKPIPENRPVYYKETVKKQKGFKSILIIALICTLVGAPLLGLSIGAGQKIIENQFTRFNTYETEIIAPRVIQQMNGDQASVVEIVREAQLSVVNITTSIVTNDFFYRHYFFGRNRETPGSGSGIVYSEDEERVFILTNYHVIENAAKQYVSFTDREQIPATLVGYDVNEDMAILSILKSDIVKEGLDNVTVARLGDSHNIEVGELVVAIGNALGNGKTVTYGIISAINKEMDFNDGRKPLSFIQTDAAINPGNSGGALVDMNGSVIGMNTAKIADYRVDGMGFAIPIDTVKPIADSIINETPAPVVTESRPFIGISGETLTGEIARSYSLIVDEGVIIVAVYENGGAYDAGLRAGDILIEFDGNKITAMEQLQQIVLEQEIGGTVFAKIVRDNSREIDVIIRIVDVNDIDFD